ncbi:biotin transport system substrate-specific component [Tranquillimonas rosea]|uniref:Biotin transporter n=1 Tax=Tranquillimonas rosea TaxID=641238 RepID=A0A1H9V308_9RHOB|nr:biotin transporter BioY [Tranquillimonas rosea]SES16210.1 biotin transport system substrate-specific component [Tranquillimonas rosea]
MSNDIPLSRAAGLQSLPVKAFMVVAGSALIAISAQVSVPMFPVPMSLQTLAISMIGLTFGARLAAVTLLAYLAQGAAGLPVFAGGHSAPALIGPTAGFLYGFVAMAWLTGFLAERGMARGFGRLFIAAFIPATLLFVPGVAWLWAATPLDFGGAMNAGAIPFLLGDVVKSTLAALAVAGGWSLLGRR